MITARGIGLVIVAIVLFALGGFTRVGWLFMFDAVLWGAAAVSALMPWLAVGKLTLQSRLRCDHDLPGPVQGQLVSLELTLSNQGPLPCMFINVSYPLVDGVVEPSDGGQRRLFVAWLGRNAAVTGTAAVVFKRRGLCTLPPVRVESRAPFGLFRRSKELGAPAEVLALPALHPVSGLDMLAQESDTCAQSSPARPGEQVVGSRSYSSGDPLSHIHWRNTARMAGPQVKEFQRTSDRSLTILLDIPSATPGSGEALEQAVQIVASIGDSACKTHGFVRLVTEGIEEALDRGSFLQRLALYQGASRHTRPLHPALVSPTDVVAVTMDTDSAAISSLARLAREGHGVTAVLMRGFDQANVPASPGASLIDAGATVIESWSGDIASTLAAIESACSAS